MKLRPEDLYPCPSLPSPAATSMDLFPPDTLCYVLARNMSHAIDCSNTSVTPAMVNYLNLTSSINTYKQAYCLNPQADDSCPFGYCPQSDIAGLLVRVSTYVTTLCLSVLIVFSKNEEDIKQAFYSSLLNAYSLLLTATISISGGNLSRFHALVVYSIAGSPLWMFVSFYAVCSVVSDKPHRLQVVVGRDKPIQLGLTIGWAFLQMSYFIFVLLPGTAPHFAQGSCDKTSFLVTYMYWVGLTVFIAGAKVHSYWMPIGFASGIITLVTLVPVMWIRWSEAVAIVKSGKGEMYKMSEFWKLTRRDYPFIFFLNAVIGPTIFWIGTVESSLQESSADNVFTPSFGQVLAVFVTIPPLVGVANLGPDGWEWFKDLCWIRAIVGAPEEKYSYKPTHGLYEHIEPEEYYRRPPPTAAYERPPPHQWRPPPPVDSYAYGHSQTRPGKYYYY
ncbi:hypothetical protein BC835DRAFT_1325811 [Cytidiella melzeri]|nr:hypothetical protein BC835DRAFT_1325811 [Cytidiella melzeri]